MIIFVGSQITSINWTINFLIDAGILAFYPQTITLKFRIDLPESLRYCGV